MSERSSRERLALRIEQVSRAWNAWDELALRSELEQLGREASALAKSIPLEGVARRQVIAGERDVLRSA